jgi:hypothetical protein
MHHMLSALPPLVALHPAKSHIHRSLISLHRWTCEREATVALLYLFVLAIVLATVSTMIVLPTASNPVQGHDIATDEALLVEILVRHQCGCRLVAVHDDEASGSCVYKCVYVCVNDYRYEHLCACIQARRPLRSPMPHWPAMGTIRHICSGSISYSCMSLRCGNAVDVAAVRYEMGYPPCTTCQQKTPRRV